MVFNTNISDAAFQMGPQQPTDATNIQETELTIPTAPTPLTTETRKKFYNEASGVQKHTRTKRTDEDCLQSRDMLD